MPKRRLLLGGHPDSVILADVRDEQHVRAIVIWAASLSAARSPDRIFAMA
jgi:hypothetical protein